MLCVPNATRPNPETACPNARLRRESTEDTINIDEEPEPKIKDRSEKVIVCCSPACPNAWLRREATENTIDADELFAELERKLNRVCPNARLRRESREDTIDVDEQFAESEAKSNKGERELSAKETIEVDSDYYRTWAEEVQDLRYDIAT
ncbi:hypothetical protein C8Q74DRAFT_1221309 [Fomes fomentarius]|nr:hypothetical protein C8Q74DRAFT_1221309 [Fomes fomentarius]